MVLILFLIEQAIELFQYQTEEAKRREKEAERERDEVCDLFLRKS